jgi:hypothetical protein
MKAIIFSVVISMLLIGFALAQSTEAAWNKDG